MIFISFLNKILLSGKKSQRYQWIDHRRRLARYYCSLIEKLYGLPMLCTADFVFRYVLSGCVRSGQTNGVTLRRDSRPIHHLHETCQVLDWLLCRIYVLIADVICR